MEYRILTLLAYCDWISIRGLKLLPYSEDRIVRALRKMQDTNTITCKKTGLSKYYALRPNGKKTLQTHEPDKYAALSQTYLKHNHNQLDRIGLMGEGIVAFEQAGYGAVDKPSVENCVRDSLEALYYTSREMKQYIYEEMEGGKDRKAINASRFNGILFSGVELVRVYSTFNTALQIRKNNELMALDPIRTLARRLCEDYNAVSTLLLGDKHFRAAERIIANSFQAANPSHRSKKVVVENSAENMTVHSLGLNNLLYLPVIKQALPLLSLYRIPQWHARLNAAFAEAAGGRPLKNTRYIDGKGKNGNIFVLITMDLVKLHYLINMMRLERPEEGFEVVYMEWQSEFLTSLLKSELPEVRFSIVELSDNAIPGFIAFSKRANNSV